MPAQSPNSAYTFDDSVEKRVTGMLSSGSPLMKQAEQQGLATANKRGLLNSSIAAGASQGAMMERATPIATADAQIAASKNLQGADIAAQMDRLRTQAGFTKENLNLELGSRERMQSQDIRAQMERLNTANDAEMKRLQASMANANEQQKTAIQAEMDRLSVTNSARMAELNTQANNASRLQAEGDTQLRGRMELEGGLLNQRMDRQFEQSMTQLQQQHGNTLATIQAQGDQQMRQTSAQLAASLQELQTNIAANDRTATMNAAASLHQTAQQLISSIMQNPDIPATERAKWINYAQQQAGIGLNLVSQLQNVGINYGYSVPGPGAA